MVSNKVAKFFYLAGRNRRRCVKTFTSRTWTAAPTIRSSSIPAQNKDRHTRRGQHDRLRLAGGPYADAGAALKGYWRPLSSSPCPPRDRSGTRRQQPRGVNLWGQPLGNSRTNPDSKFRRFPGAVRLECFSLALRGLIGSALAAFVIASSQFSDLRKSS